MKIKYTFVTLMVSLLFISACGQKEHPYRYPCQNTDNWDKPQCQKPKCEVHRECPEHIFKNFDEMKGQ
jgi:hypothetical protein